MAPADEIQAVVGSHTASAFLDVQSGDAWEAMRDSLVLTPENYMANCETIRSWYETHTGFDTDGWTLEDLTPGSLDIDVGGTKDNPRIVEGVRGGPARWSDNWITFRHCLIDDYGANAAYANPKYGSGTYGIRFENCTFLQSPPIDRDCAVLNTPGGDGDYYGVTFYRCDITGFGGGLKPVGGGLLAEYCYFHDMQASSTGGQHVTCVTARGGRHHVVRCFGSDGGSGMFNAYFEFDMTDMLHEECIAIGMSPNASASYAFDCANDEGFAASSEDMRWIDCLVGKIADDPLNPDPGSYAGIQYGPFSSVDGLDFGRNAEKSGCLMIEDGSPF